ncbi:MAG: hypothetical protein HC837_07465 [Chloroflexaceae bacterium]|nr:hypothetical protein [Chloroflexaceae bacterium]
MEDLMTLLQQVETQLDQKTYQPGAWQAFLRTARRQPRVARQAIRDDVSRVSEKLHLRGGRRTMPVKTALILEGAVTAGGVLLLVTGLARSSPVLVLAAAGTLSFTAQPLIKTTLARLLGVRYAYAYLQYIEPRFKMHYGTYLASPRWKRVLVQLGGTPGSPLAFALVGIVSSRRTPQAASICGKLAWLTVVLQVFPFSAGLLGVHSLGPLKITTGTSAGAAAHELREGWLLGLG